MKQSKPSIVLDSSSSDEDDIDDKGGQNEKVPVANKTQMKKGAVKALNPQEVRWYHKMPKSASWLPFGGRDSLLIELKWRINENINLGDDFPERDEALEICEKPIVVLDGYYELILGEEKLVVKPIYWIGDPLEILRGTWFFEDGLRPLDQKLADEIEEQHLKMFTGQNVPDGPVYAEKSQKPVLHSLQSETCRIVWNSIIDVTMHVAKGSSWVTYLRFKSNILKLRRCYDAEASLTDGPLPINHLIFVVHGIGQKRQANRIVANTTGIADQALKRSFADLKYRPMFLPVEWRTCLKLDEDVVEAITPSKVQFIRSLLNSTVMDILYYSSPKYRSEVTDGMVTVLNKLHELFITHNSNFERDGGKISIVAHSLGSVISYDVITKWSPLHQYEDFVNERLNHVLESPLISDEEKKDLARLKKAREVLDEKEGGLLHLLAAAEVDGGLAFKVQNLFCVGSPLSVFLTLRGQTGGKIFQNNPLVLYNVFHPMDPVAYRLEPLIHPLYAKYKPLRIHRIDVKDPTPYADMPMELNKNPPKRKQSKGKSQPIAFASVVQSESNPESDGRTTPDARSEKKFAAAGWTTNLLSKLRGDSSSSNLVASSNNVAAAVTPKDGNVVVPAKETVTMGSACGSSSGSTESLNDPPPVLISQVSDGDPLAQIPPENRLPYRLDYILKEATLDYELVSALTSHVSYWTHSDVIMFVLTQIYGQTTR